MSELSEGAQFRLLVLGDGSVRTIPLEGSRWIVGRAIDCDVPLRDPTVSRRHVLLERHGEQFSFQDLGGSNPVMLDGRACKQGVIAPDQTLTIGLTRIVLERRAMATPVATSAHPTVVLSREVADDELLPTSTTSFASTAARVLERIEWTFADLGDLTHAAEPLLDLSLNLTGRRCGWIGRFTAHGRPETLASLDTAGERRAVTVPAELFAEARRIARPHVLTTQEGDASRARLMIPLGSAGEGLIVLEDASPDAPAGQELLRLAHSLRMVVWHRLQETMERLRLRDEVQRLRFQGTAAHNALLASTRLHDARQALRAVAGGTDPLLLVGEEGTELEDLARYLHSESPRRTAPFVRWSAADVPDARQGRDLFRDGSGADGAFHRAGSGTLFVDRFDRLAAPLQERLARSLRTPAADGVPPVLVATTPALHALRAPPAGFDWPPHQRIEVPPLRANARDVVVLAELFLSELGACPDGSPRLLTERAKRLLVAHPWPGNVRELRLVLEFAAAQAGNQPIAPRHLPPAIANEQTGGPPEVATLEEVERQHIADVVHRTGGNRTRAAQLLGIATSTLYEKMKRYRIES
jgi:transcriptional regulator with AAA-type ATPase domain